MNVILSVDIGTTTIGALALDVGSGETLLVQSVANAANAAGSQRGITSETRAQFSELRQLCSRGRQRVCAKDFLHINPSREMKKSLKIPSTRQ